ncbi:MAG: CoA-binding protein [Gemmatimonadota bacterium]|nr:CoA-binding protein [Gemmatimonadota bacterium]MDH5197185.1 CoA-binding protein [Gemmatimonadota bacterium]
MPKQLPDAVAAFLAGRRVAVAGVSREPGHVGNAVFKKLRAAGFDVVPLNPGAAEVEGVPSYPDLAAVPGSLDGVVVTTHPDTAESIVRQAAACGVRHVWLHRSFGQGSVSEAALRAADELGIACIAGGCPLMYCEPVDLGHRCMRWWFRRKGRVP